MYLFRNSLPVPASATQIDEPLCVSASLSHNWVTRQMVMVVLEEKEEVAVAMGVEPQEVGAMAMAQLRRQRAAHLLEATAPA